MNYLINFKEREMYLLCDCGNLTQDHEGFCSEKCKVRYKNWIQDRERPFQVNTENLHGDLNVTLLERYEYKNQEVNVLF
jgi:hypothetical protein